MIRNHVCLVAIGAMYVLLVALGGEADAQLRIVTYNTNTFGTEVGNSNIRRARSEVDTVLQAIGEESVNGIARPADIILLQEQQQPNTTTQDLVNRLNTIYAGQGITYARGTRIGNTTSGNGMGTPNAGEIRQGVIYRTDSVQLISETSFGDLSGGLISQPRQTLLHQFRPSGYGPDADLYIFNSHFEAGDFQEDLAGRETEAREIRRFIDNNQLGNRNVIVAGDLNVDSNFESSGIAEFGGNSALEILSASGNGRVLDPLFPNGESVDFQIYNFGVPNTPFGVNLAPFLTQSPTGQGGSLVGGGIDDRFDFILQSDELLDGEGVASIHGSLRSFGNNGSTPNDQINDGNTININGLTSFTTGEVLDALEAASDHLPVITDFQVPAMLEAILVGSIPDTIMLGDAIDLEVTIANIADVLVPLAADELDFQLITSGDLIGNASGVDSALGGVFSTLVTLDTTQSGVRDGIITVSSSSPGVANGQVVIPVSFTVTAIPEPSMFALLCVGGIAMARKRRRALLSGTSNH
ncbi:MAG: endonuclease/exonuclease/phosphatase family protein [Planctomycetota bacterium]